MCSRLLFLDIVFPCGPVTLRFELHAHLSLVDCPTIFHAVIKRHTNNEGIYEPLDDL